MLIPYYYAQLKLCLHNEDNPTWELRVCSEHEREGPSNGDSEEKSFGGAIGGIFRFNICPNVR